MAAHARILALAAVVASLASGCTRQVQPLFDGSRVAGGSDPAPYARLGTTGGDASVATVADPAGLPRDVVRITTDGSAPAGGVVRTQLISPPLLGAGADVWVLTELYLPPGFPTVSSDGWATLTSVYGPPYGGPGPNSIGLRALRGRNRFTWVDEAGGQEILWQRPAVPGRWWVIARRLRMGADPATGSTEIWFAEHGRPLRRQSVAGAPAGRRRQATLVPGVNWDTDRASDTFRAANTSRIGLYHRAGMPGWERRLSIYARHVILPGDITVDAVQRVVDDG